MDPNERNASNRLSEIRVYVSALGLSFDSGRGIRRDANNTDGVSCQLRRWIF